MDDWGDDDWGDDVIEECVQLASQASAVQTSTPAARNVQNHQSDLSLNSSNVKQASVFVFKEPTKSKVQVMCPPPNKLPASSAKSPTAIPQHNQSSTSIFSDCHTNQQSVAFYEQEIERLKNENQQLVDANLIKTGETSILRADIQSLRTSFEKRETEANQELTALRKQIKQMESHHHKQVESSKTEMKFKEIELEELRNKCKRAVNDQHSGRDSVRLPIMAARESPSSSRFLNKTLFEADSKPPNRKVVVADAQIQTDDVKRFRLGTDGLDDVENTKDLVDALKFSLQACSTDPQMPIRLMEKLRLRMIANAEEHLPAMLHSGEPSVVELVYRKLGSLKSTTEQCKPFVDFVDCWITHVLVLPSVERHKCNRFLNSVLTEIRRLAFQDILTISTAIVFGFGLTPICKKTSGCLLAKAALQLKEAYPTLNPEAQYQTAQQLVLALSAMAASPVSDNFVNCPCIPHLLKVLVLIVQHQTEIDGLSATAAKRRLNFLVRAFRLSLSILNSRREPWTVFVKSPSEVSRLYTVLTTISVEFPIPKSLADQINVSAFTGPGLDI